MDGINGPSVPGEGAAMCVVAGAQFKSRVCTLCVEAASLAACGRIDSGSRTVGSCLLYDIDTQASMLKLFSRGKVR